MPTVMDDTRALLDLLGSHWAATYGGRDFVGRLVAARAMLEQQLAQDFSEAAAAVGRLTTPVYHTDLWYQLTLRQSELAAGALLHFGQGKDFGNQPVGGELYHFGLPAPGTGWTFSLPEDLQEMPLLANRIHDPSLILVEGLDYTVDAQRHTVTFLRANPFADPLVPTRTVYADGVEDREAGLWAHRALFDHQQIYQHVGYVLGCRLPTSPRYRDFCNAVWDGLVEGANEMALREALAAMADAPLVRTAGETVEVITTGPLGLQVITDRNTYQCGAGASAVVAVGDVLQAGDFVCDAVRLFTPNRGGLPDLLALTLDRRFLSAGYRGGLTFVNEDVPLSIEQDGDDVRASFVIGGWPGDVARFWDELHSRAAAAGTSLAALLDQRTTKEGPPPASALPTTINPLQFLAANVLRGNYVVAQLRPGSYGPSALPDPPVTQLGRLLPPHTALVLAVELAADGEEIPAATAVAESSGTYSGGEAPGDTIYDYTFIVESTAPDAPRARYVDGVCL